MNDVYLKGPLNDEANDQPGFKPREDIGSWPLEIPLNWDADPFNDRNWQFQLHAWRMIDPLFRDYFKTNDEQILHKAFAYTLDWFSYHYEHGRSSKMAWYDMAAGIRAKKLALFLDRYYAGKFELSADQARRLVTLVDEHVRRLQEESYIAKNNHGLFQVFGLNLLCLVAADRQPCVHGRGFASRMFSSILDSQFTDEGVHREHSPAYHRFVRLTIETLGGAKRFDDPRTQALLSKAAKVEAWLIDPSGNLVAVGDSSGRARRMALDDNTPAIAGDFTKSGYAVVRDKDSMLFVMGMANSLTHKHADDLSFVLFEHGRPLFIDTGKYGYNDDPMRDYIESAAAHNTVSLLNQEIKPHNLAASGSALSPIVSDGELFTIRGEIDRPGLLSQYRVIRYIPGRSIIIRDEISSSRPRQYVSSLHLARDLTPQLTDGGFDVALPDGKYVKARLSETDCTIDTTRGQMAPPLGWESISYLKMGPASVVRAICSGQSRTITWNVTLQ